MTGWEDRKAMQEGKLAPVLYTDVELKAAIAKMKGEETPPERVAPLARARKKMEAALAAMRPDQADVEADEKRKR